MPSNPQAAPTLLAPSGGRCVVLADAKRTRRTRRWLRKFHAEAVLVLTTDTTGWKPSSGTTTVRETPQIEDVVRELQKFGQIDVILSLLPSSRLPSGVRDQYDLFSRTFLYLRPGGTYLADHTVERGAPLALAPQLRRLSTAEDRPGAPKKEIALSRAVGAMVDSPDLLLVTKKRRHYLRLRGSRIDDVLPERDPATTVELLSSRPAGSFEARAVETSYGPRLGEPMPQRLEYPEMALRRYTGEISSAGGMRIFTSNTILPDSYRWYFAPRGGGPKFGPAGGELSEIPRRIMPKRTLAGDYYNLDCQFDGHFGHLTTEVVSRLWGWHEAKRENPELKALFHVRPKRNNDPRLERALFTAYGIAESDLVWVEGPVKLNSLVSATPMWQDEHPHFAHPDIQEVWGRLTAGLLDGAAPTEHERIFVSRGPTLSRRRACRNQAEVERFFADRGFHVFYPEQLTLPEQVALFAGARVVAGFAGSAMFNLMHTKRLEATIVLSHHGYAARNEHLYAAVLGGELHYFWSAADIPPPKKGRSVEAVRSSWTFDFADQGADLDRVIAAH